MNESGVGKVGLVLLIGFVIWWLFFRNVGANAADGYGSTGYMPPNDPRRVNDDPRLNNAAPLCTKRAPFTPVASALSWSGFRSVSFAPGPSNVTAQFPPQQFPWMYQAGSQSIANLGVGGHF